MVISDSPVSDLDDSDSDDQNLVEDDLAKSYSKQKNLESLIQKMSVDTWTRKDKDANNNSLSGVAGSKKSSLTNSEGMNGKATDLLVLKNTKINQGLLQGLNRFHKKQQEGFVDVWWMYDDGGLTLLIAYLLLRAKNWKKCKLRIFIQTKSADVEISEEQIR